MRSLFRSFYEGVQAAAGAFGQWAFTHRRPIGLFVLMGAVFLAPTTVEAWSIAGAAQEALKLILGLLGWIVQMLGELFVFLVDIFLGFARYNAFGEAQPVKIGWVIVRDICNMFFIVVLLISAFNTIIGWDSSLRYNQVLPKLLLMAILINFSRTLIQVLIDFSQVVMLTFVNAFQAAGAGNFAAAFRINDLLSMRDNFAATGETAVRAAGESNPGNYDLAAQLFTSFLLALVLIVIANGVMLIMIVYILARIIGLWIALIFSPIAFFVKALPSSLQSGLASFSGKYWSRLAGMLTGGPVVMFFIYLTFAILQTAPANPPANPNGQTAGGSASSPSVLGAQGGGLAGQLELHTSPTAAAGTSFITRVGTSDNVASFIIAVALMLMAIEAAVEASNSVSESVGKVVGTIGSASKGLAFGAAALVASSPWLATKLGYRTVDKRYDLTGKASTLGLWTANKIPIAGQFARPLLMKGMMMRKNEREAEAKANMAAMDGMTPDQLRLVQAGFRSVPGAALGGVANALTGKISSGLQSLSFKAQEKGGALGRVGGGVLSGLSRGVDKANKGLGQAWFSGGDQLTNLEIAKKLSSDEMIAEDQAREEDRQEDALSRDIRWKGFDKDAISASAENRAAKNVRAQVSEQLATREQMAKRSIIDSPAERAAVKAQAKKNPLLWADEKKRMAKAKQLFEKTSGIKNLDSDAKNDAGLVVRGLIGRGIATLNDVDGKTVVAITGDKAARDKLLKEIAAVDKDYADTVDQYIKAISSDKVKDENGNVIARGSLFDEITQSRIEIDSGDTKRVVNDPDVGRTLMGKVGDRIEAATGIKLPIGAVTPVSMFGKGSMANWAAATAQTNTMDPTGRVRRNATELEAINKLAELAKKDEMDTEAAGEAFGSFIDANGQIGDIENLPGFEKAIDQFVAGIRQQVTPLLAYDDREGLQVSDRVLNEATGVWEEGGGDDARAANSALLQTSMKQLRPLAQQIGDRMKQETIEKVLQALDGGVAGQMRFNVTRQDARGVNRVETETMPITDVWAASRASSALKDKDAKEAGYTLFSAAQAVASSEGASARAGGQAAARILKKANDLHASSRSEDRRKLSAPVRRALDAGTDG